mmetsp:Transcript_16273/g.30965  ORF Transcript_16273/g.30965 Transcript_16273/m.30965 type:complete len:206 (-) Transcript_16273:391-1008(-)
MHGYSLHWDSIRVASLVCERTLYASKSHPLDCSLVVPIVGVVVVVRAKLDSSLRCYCCVFPCDEYSHYYYCYCFHKFLRLFGVGKHNEVSFDVPCGEARLWPTPVAMLEEEEVHPRCFFFLKDGYFHHPSAVFHHSFVATKPIVTNCDVSTHPDAFARLDQRTVVLFVSLVVAASALHSQYFWNGMEVQRDDSCCASVSSFRPSS